jgi:ABC-type transporter Mla subunit MlaD
MGWRRGADCSGSPAPDPRTAILDAIRRIGRDQQLLSRRIEDAYVQRIQLDRVLHEQSDLLAQAVAQIQDAITEARRAAESARAGDQPAAQYEQTVAGLRSQLAVVEASAADLERLRGDVAASSARVARLLRESAASLDATLRAEVGLLARLERLERERVIAAARRQHRD